ncbi:outer membrane beta-barrel protein [Chitinophaga sp. 30R24]|uniref:outer membrane beta-barrel protein n=1 Tax=Chitinophaga sp. 30R24 TaxID=3248838 RepID=UPI003B8FA732
MKLVPSLLVFLLLPFLGVAQGGRIYGSVLDSLTRKPLYGVSLSLLYGTDSSNTGNMVLSSADGTFLFSNIKKGYYNIYLSYIGYHAFITERIKVDTTIYLVKDILLSPKGINLSQIEIIGTKSAIAIKKDTIEFDAGMFKVQETASLETLLKRIPGAEITSDGSIKINGEVVKNIMVDGHAFFGTNTKISTQNLLSGIIDKIQIIDRVPENSDQPGGINEKSEKVINITIKKDHYKRINGLLGLGGGTESTFAAKASLNRFTEGQQVAVIGNSNNINGFMDNMDGSGVDGKSLVTNAGTNFSQNINNKVAFSGSYLFNQGRTSVNSILSRQNLLEDSIFYNKSQNSGNRNTMAHAIDLNLIINIDSLSTLKVNGGGNIATSNNNASSDYSSFAENYIPTNVGKSFQRSQSQNDIFSLILSYQRKFSTKGQTIQTKFSFKNSINNGNSSDYATTTYNNSSGLSTIDTLNQITADIGIEKNYQLSIYYEQPIFNSWLLGLSNNLIFISNSVDKKVYGNNLIKTDIDNLVDSLSGKIINNQITNISSMYIRNKLGKLDYNIGLNLVSYMQYGGLNGAAMGLQNKAIKINPEFSLSYLLNATKSLNIFYGSKIQSPNANMLNTIQEVISPTMVAVGDPSLRPVRNETLKLSFRYIAPNRVSSLFLNSVTNILHDNIISATSIDTLGRFFVKPVNIKSGFFSTSTSASYSMPLSKKGPTLSLSTSLNYKKGVSLTNENLINIKYYILSQGVIVHYAYKSVFDISLYGHANYNMIKYSNQANSLTKFGDYSMLGDLTFNLPFRVSVGGHFSYLLNNGRGDTYNTNNLILNPQISKQLFRNSRGLIKFQAFDLLGVNNSNKRVIESNYIEDSMTNVLERFYLISFTYFLK